MKALRYHGPKTFRIDDIPVPQPKPDEVLMRVAYCGICGSDLHTYKGGPFPGPGVLHPERIEPYVIGHEFAGVIEETGTSCTAFSAGDRVVAETFFTCGECPACRAGFPNVCEKIAFIGGPEHDGGFTEYCRIPEKMLHRIPDGLPYEKAALADPLAVALHALRTARWIPGSTAVVAGAGSIGLAVVIALKACGAEDIIVLQRKSPRQEIAKTLGADLVLDPDEEDAARIIKERTGGLGAGFTFETTGHEPNFRTLYESLRPQGCECVISLWRDPVPFSLTDLVNGEKAITGSDCFLPEEFDEVLQMLSDGRMNAEGYVTSVIPLEDAVEKGFEVLAGRGGKSDVKILVQPSPLTP